MRLALVGLGLLLVGGVAVVAGLLPAADVAALAERVLPILAYVVAVTVVAELAAEAGLFRTIAARLGGLARGRAIVLWLLVAALAVVATAFLSLDTTAVLLTPVVVLLAAHAGLRPHPFALATVWLANAASLWLPVSNLTNLLAAHRLGVDGPADFLALLWAPALVATLVPIAIMLVLFRRELASRFVPEAAEHAEDPVLLGIAAAVVALLLPLLVTGVEPWIPATAAALVLVVAFALRRRAALGIGLVPVPLLLFAAGLFLVVEAAHALGMTAALAVVAGEGEGLDALLRLSLGGALAANVVDNLPAYLALEPVADSPARLAALLVGVNAGPLITPWASLATLLWHARLTSLGVEISWRRYVLLGLVAAPLTVAAATLALWLAQGMP